jgi:predicted ATP-dependent protease
MSFKEYSLGKNSFSHFKGISSNEASALNFFDLSSHKRAREALEFGLKMRSQGFHVFVIGAERSGRMSATVDYLGKHIKELPSPKDWVYLNNFLSPYNPKPYALPNGVARKLEAYLKEFIRHIKAIFNKTFNHAAYLKKIDSLNESVQQHIDQQIQQIKNFAKHKGYNILEQEEGFNIEILEEESEKLSGHSAQDLQIIKVRLNKVSGKIYNSTRQLQKDIDRFKRSTAQKALAPFIQKLRKDYGLYLGKWIEELKDDVLKRIDEFLEAATPNSSSSFNLEEWYGVNVFVDHTESSCPKVVLEPHPLYENLFGAIKYRAVSGGVVETNFMMLRPGALHQANGGILILRAEMIANNPEVWEALKAALRDEVVQIKDQGHESSLPLMDAPNPESIPLDIQVILVGSPHWYYTFFFEDFDFRSHFKIKAEIDPDLPATPENLRLYAHLIHKSAYKIINRAITEEGVNYLLKYSSRWVGHIEKLSARFELIIDILQEAAALITTEPMITEEVIVKALNRRRLRNSSSEDYSFQSIIEEQIFVEIEGQAIGQVNALAMLSTGDHHYGLPTRISARTYIGEEGIVNIERMVNMGGPLQQKATLILEGMLNALFAQKFPLSYTCSLTFEQSYSEIEGDSASMAELIAILSSLSGLPLRQDIAITGSMNQFGSAQPVGGIHHKVEGFHRLCKIKGMNGKQGVIIPNSNVVNLTLQETVLKDIEAQQFHIWPVKTVFEAIEILLGCPCGIPLKEGMLESSNYPYYDFEEKSVFEKVYKQLEAYHIALMAASK